MNIYIELPPNEKERINFEATHDLNKILLDGQNLSAQAALDKLTGNLLHQLKKSKASEYWLKHKHAEEIKSKDEKIAELNEVIQRKARNE